MKVSFASSAPAKKNKFDLSSFHMMTTDFGRTVPTNILELVQGDVVDVNLTSFFRMSPLAVPTYGNARFLTRAFFVPNRVIEPAWENFIRQAKDTTIKKTLLSFTNNEFVAYFFSGIFVSNSPVAVGSGNTFVVRVDDSSAECDISLDYLYGSSSPYTHKNYKFNFTDRGRWLYQVLQGLGYGLNWVYSEVSGAVGGDNTPFDMLPLRAFARCLYDYIYPSAYVDMQGFGWLFTEPDKYNTLDYHLNVVNSLLFAPYDQDHYTSCWQTINSVVANSQVYTSINSLGAAVRDSSGTTIHSDDDDVSVQQNNGAQVTTLSSISLRMLQSISDTLTRHNLVGTRFAERMKALFGFATQENKINQSIFLKSFVMDSNFQDVTNLAQVEGSVLGEMAGKGYSSGNGKLHFECSEYGYLIFITQVVPSIGYYQGRSHMTIARAPFEYYDGANDGITLAPVRNDELFADYQHNGDTYASIQSYGGNPAGVFGFSDFYQYYKHGRDYCTGDFRLGSRNQGLEAYHTLRILPQPSFNSKLELNASFLQVLPHDYDRIFAQMSSSSMLRWNSFSSNVNIVTDSDGRALALRGSNNSLYVVVYYTNNSYYRFLQPTEVADGVPVSRYMNAFGYFIGGNVYSYTDNTSAVFEIGGTRYTLSSSSISPELIGTIAGVSYDSNYDHFIGYMNFKVDAYRNMKSYSEAIPMFNKSGKEVTASYEGTQL